MASTLSKQGTASFFNDPTFSDPTITFSDRTILAHRTILSNKSEYFYRAFTGKFKEAESGIVDLSNDEDPEVIDMMLRHIYGALSSRAVNTADEFATEVLLFTAADKYDVPTLRLATTDSTLNSLSNILRKESVSQGFCDAIAAVYAHVGDKSLQDKVSTFCHQNIETMMESKEFMKMLPNVGELSFKLLTKSREQLRDANKKAVTPAVIEPCSGSISDHRPEAYRLSEFVGGGRLDRTSHPPVIMYDSPSSMRPTRLSNSTTRPPRTPVSH